MSRSLRRLAVQTAPLQDNSVALSGGEFNPSIAGAINTNYTFYDTTQYAAIATYFPGSIIRLATTISRLCPTIGTVNTTKGAELKTAIGWANANGLKVLVDLHDGGGKYISGTDNKIGSVNYTQANFVSDLSALATYLNGTAGFFGIGLSNEPNGMPIATNSSNYLTATWTLAANAGCAAIKAVNPSIKTSVCTDNFSGFQVLVSTYPTNPFTNADYIEIHCYFDSDNSGSYSGANQYFSGCGRDIHYGETTLDACAAWARTNNAKLWLGETGVPAYDEGYITMLNQFYKSAADNSDVVKGITYFAVKTGWFVSANIACDITYPLSQMNVISRYVGTGF